MASATKYYAGMISGKRRALLLGPYDTKAEAEAQVERAHDAAIDLDQYAWFATPGVFALEYVRHPAGRLNEILNI